MIIRPCPADRSRALARLRKGAADRVKRMSLNMIEVKLPCGCVVEVDFSDPLLSKALEKSLRAKQA